ncbi:MAG: hypothetical protein ABI878_13265 [Acidobacteriota bacterium]
MKAFLIILLVVGSCGLMRSDASNIKGVLLQSGYNHNGGKGEYHTVSLWPTGSASKEDETFESNFPKTGVVKHRYEAHISPADFESLAKKIADLGFYSKAVSDEPDVFEDLIVIDAVKGQKAISVVESQDRDVIAMANAVRELTKDLQWKEMPAN